MVSHCANPKCAKPLHYLREGRIFVFDMPSGEADEQGRRSRRMEHYWLCGVCSQNMAMEQSAEGVRVVSRRRSRVEEVVLSRSAMAS
jgi:hypothetical protein